MKCDANGERETEGGIACDIDYWYGTMLSRMVDADVRAQENVARVRGDLTAVLELIFEHAHDEACKIRRALYLFWEYPDIPTEVLSLAFYGQSKKHAKFHMTMVGATPRCECPECGQMTLRAIGRSVGYQEICDRCQSAQRNEKDAEKQARWEAERTARDARIYELRSMPYREYLQTPEWMAFRAARLKSTHYRCQVCNGSNQTLNVHHRTYKRRGQEYANDVVVLCADCHRLFHEQGKLAHSDGE